jgi:RNA polymerase sigma factor (sigma-70 family)
MDDGDNPITSLVGAAASGDERAWRDLVDRYTPLLATVIRRFGLTTAETQDVAQTVWLRLVEHLGGLREPRALPMWLITTGRRECLRCLSERRRTVPYDPLDPSWQASPAEDLEPDADLLRAERHEVLLAGLAELPAPLRDLLLLLTQDPPLSYAEISQRTGIRVGSIGPTRGRALERLRETFAVRELMARPARMPVAAGEAARPGRAAAGEPDRPRER